MYTEGLDAYTDARNLSCADATVKTREWDVADRSRTMCKRLVETVVHSQVFTGVQHVQVTRTVEAQQEKF